MDAHLLAQPVKSRKPNFEINIYVVLGQDQKFKPLFPTTQFSNQDVIPCPFFPRSVRMSPILVPFFPFVAGAKRGRTGTWLGGLGDMGGIFQ